MTVRNTSTHRESTCKSGSSTSKSASSTSTSTSGTGLLDRVFAAALQTSSLSFTSCCNDKDQIEIAKDKVDATADDDQEDAAYAYDSDEYDDEHDDDDHEYSDDDLVEEISEMEMLALMDQYEDALIVCRRLLKYSSSTGDGIGESEKEDGGESGAVDITSDDDNANDRINDISLQLLTPSHAASLYRHGWFTVDDVLDEESVREMRALAEQAARDGRMRRAGESRDLGDDDDPYRDEHARGDFIKWIPSTSALPLRPDGVDDPLADFLHRSPALTALYHDCTQLIHLHGQREHQLAYYPAQHMRADNLRSHYERHRDAFPVDDREDREQRRLTCIVYLNAQWKEGDGGQLVIYRRGGNGSSESENVSDSESENGSKSICNIDKCNNNSIDKCNNNSNDINNTSTIKPIAGRCVVFLSGCIDHRVLETHADRFALTTWFR